MCLIKRYIPKNRDFHNLSNFEHNVLYLNSWANICIFVLFRPKLETDLAYIERCLNCDPLIDFTSLGFEVSIASDRQILNINLHKLIFLV